MEQVRGVVRGRLRIQEAVFLSGMDETGILAKGASMMGGVRELALVESRRAACVEVGTGGINDLGLGAYVSLAVLDYLLSQVNKLAIS